MLTNAMHLADTVLGPFGLHSMDLLPGSLHMLWESTISLSMLTIHSK